MMKFGRELAAEFYFGKVKAFESFETVWCWLAWARDEVLAGTIPGTASEVTLGGSDHASGGPLRPGGPPLLGPHSRKIPATVKREIPARQRKRRRRLVPVTLHTRQEAP
jgi:hypothetical protein